MIEKATIKCLMADSRALVLTRARLRLANCGSKPYSAHTAKRTMTFVIVLFVVERKAINRTHKYIRLTDGSFIARLNCCYQTTPNTVTPLLISYIYLILLSRMTFCILSFLF